MEFISQFDRYQMVRNITEQICAPLEPEDYQVQSSIEVSPPKWHLAHVTWFFETFVLKKFLPDYEAYDPRFHYIFNSYYQTLGSFHARDKRGNLARPTISEIFSYRKHVDSGMEYLFAQSDHNKNELLAIIELGLHHEQQHQELLLMDIKYNYFCCPLKPAYLEAEKPLSQKCDDIHWHEQEEGIFSIGHNSDNFCYDNEKPDHKVFIQGFKIANRLVTNGEFLQFIEDNGYQRPDLWLSDGWGTVQREQWQHPLYWSKKSDTWTEFSLYGEQPLDLNDPVCHISYFEADAYARWRGSRLPTEAELEIQLKNTAVEGNFFDNGILHPISSGQKEEWFGNLWNWSSSAYQPYPGFEPFAGSAGEYNGKFMCNQNVLRGGACVSSKDHIRSTYRNFFYPQDRWQFSGIRLAGNL